MHGRVGLEVGHFHLYRLLGVKDVFDYKTYFYCFSCMNILRLCYIGVENVCTNVCMQPL